MRCMSGNQLKIIALIAMTCDHVAVQLLPQWQILRVIGRLALPVFAYMIAEGCRYTKNRKRYLMGIAAIAALCQIVYFVAQKSVYQGILVTFSLSIVLIYAIDYAKMKKTVGGWFLVAATGLILTSQKMVEGNGNVAVQGFALRCQLHLTVGTGE